MQVCYCSSHDALSWGLVVYVFMLEFDVTVSLLCLDNLYVDTFEIKDMKILRGNIFLELSIALLHLDDLYIDS